MWLQNESIIFATFPGSTCWNLQNHMPQAPLFFFSHFLPKKTHSPSRGQRGCPVTKKIRLGRCRRPVVEMAQIETGKNSTFNKLQHVLYTHGLVGFHLFLFSGFQNTPAFRLLWRVFMKVSVGKCWVVKSSWFGWDRQSTRQVPYLRHPRTSVFKAKIQDSEQCKSSD